MWNSIKLNFKHFKGFLKEKYFAGLYCQDPLTNVSQGERWQNISGVMGKIQILTLKKENSEILIKCCSVGKGTEFSPIKEV